MVEQRCDYIETEWVKTMVRTLIALFPLLWILWGLGWKRWRSIVVCPIALGIALILAFFPWSIPPVDALKSLLEGLTLAVWPILWTILAAVYTYRLSVATRAIDGIKSSMISLSPDHRVQTLLITFALGGFLEAVAGFGSAVAIPTGILIALGFSPLVAATASLVANTIPVAFGALGIPVITLAQLTTLPLNTLTLNICLQLFPLVVFLPLFLIYITTQKLTGLRGMIGIGLTAGLTFGLGQTLVGYYLGPELAAIAGSFSAFLGILLYSRIKPGREPWRVAETQESMADWSPRSTGDWLRPWWPYLFVLILVVATRMLPFLQFLRQSPLVTEIHFFAGSKPLPIDWFAAPGTLLLFSAIAGGLIQGAGPAQQRKVFGESVRQLIPTFLTVISIVALAKVMAHSGMVGQIAASLAAVTGKAFPFFSPLLGALGTFLTGSDTSANVLFGALQKQTALNLHLSPAWLTAANTSGATAGKMISPQSIAIAAAAAGMSGQEGTILRKTMIICLAYATVIGVLVWLGSIYLR